MPLYDMYRGQETEEKFASEGGGTTWAEQTDAEERAAAAERHVQLLFVSLYRWQRLHMHKQYVSDHLSNVSISLPSEL